MFSSDPKAFRSDALKMLPVPRVTSKNVADQVWAGTLTSYQIRTFPNGSSAMLLRFEGDQGPFEHYALSQSVTGIGDGSITFGMSFVLKANPESETNPVILVKEG